jgi:hypothetical protein
MNVTGNFLSLREIKGDQEIKLRRGRETSMKY